MAKVAIIHGTTGSPHDNWFPWLAAELAKKGHEVLVPRMPTPDGQSLGNWRQAFQTQCGDLNASTVVIGHSVGAVFLLRLLEQAAQPIAASIFVGGFTGILGLPEFDRLNASFIEGPYDWKTIRSNAGSIICYSGDKDPYVPLAQGLELAENLGVTPKIIAGGGHLNAESGYTTFPLLLEELGNVKMRSS